MGNVDIELMQRLSAAGVSEEEFDYSQIQNLIKEILSACQTKSVEQLTAIKKRIS